MDLVSCSCGVVLDRNRLPFPAGPYVSRQGVDMSKAVWDSERRDFFPFVPCPVCKAPVTTKEPV